VKNLALIVVALVGMIVYVGTIVTVIVGLVKFAMWVWS
jgi:hypothetical protein